MRRLCLWIPFAWLLAVHLLPGVAGAPARSQPPRVNRSGMLVRNGRPYRAIGVNYFDLFYRTLKNPSDTSYRQGLRALSDRGIPFARFMAGGFWPSAQKLYLENEARYFALLDSVVQAAEETGVGLIPSLFWNVPTVPDLVGEPVNQWGNPKSKTHAFMRDYVRKVVTRYRKSPAIWGWEFGNEYTLMADLPNAAQHRPPVVPELGTPVFRSELDELSYTMIRTALQAFASEVRRYDKRRMITSGNGLPRPSAWHQEARLSWEQDSCEQYLQVLFLDNPAPMNLVSIHVYGEEKRFNGTPTQTEMLRLTREACEKQKRVLFVGEFGVGWKQDRAKEKEAFTRLLSAIESCEVPLAALWVYDYQDQDTSWNVTADNERSYQLEAIAKVNRRLQEEER